MDKMVLSVGREYLRRVHEYIKKTPEFQILPVLCRDSERLNSTKRWEIRARPQSRFAVDIFESTDGQQEKQPTQNEQPQNDAIQPKDTKQNDPIVPSNSTHENATEIPIEAGKNFEVIDREFYNRMGDNFARVLLKRYRNEKLEKEEIEYMDRWLCEESVHYGFMGIYCHEGENVEELTKRIGTFLIEEKP